MGLLDFLLLGALLNSGRNNRQSNNSSFSNSYSRGYDDGYDDACIDHDYDRHDDSFCLSYGTTLWQMESCGGSSWWAMIWRDEIPVHSLWYGYNLLWRWKVLWPQQRACYEPAASAAGHLSHWNHAAATMRLCVLNKHSLETKKSLWQ